MPGPSGNAPPVGRPLNDAATNFVWEQRIHREEAVNWKAQPGFSLRAAMSVTDVPVKFKVGHMDPQEAMRAASAHFDPASIGWDADCDDAREFRRNWGVQTEGPRMRTSYPQTTYHELGWLLAPRGNPADRIERRKIRMGLAWPEGPPAGFSDISSAHPAQGSTLSAAAPSDLSAVASSVLSCGSRPDVQIEKRSSPNKLARAGASQVSACSDSHVAAARYERSRSVPALSKAARAQRLGRCERDLEEALDESRRYLNTGTKGSRWTRFLNGTDVTDFDDKFTVQNGGVPLYKMAIR